jgi:lysophospholipase L1-like esterase
MKPLRTTQKLGRLAVVTLSMVLLGELVTRLVITAPSAQQPDEELGWTYLPGAVVFNGREGHAHHRTNRLGLIDREPEAVEARYRVLVFGDSLTESLQVPLDENFTSALEQRFAELDVVNLGRSDMSPAHYPIVAARMAAELPADLYVVTVNPGDAVDLLREDVVVTYSADAAHALTDLSVVPRGSDRLKALAEPLISRSALATHLMRRAKSTVEELLALVSALRSGAEEPVEGAAGAVAADAADAGALGAYRSEALAVTERLAWVLGAMRDRGTPVLLLVLPEIDYQPRGVAADAAPDTTAWFAAAARAAGVPVVSAAPQLISRYAATGVPGHGFADLQIGVGHLNPSGHEAVADALAAWLRAETGLRPRSGAP